MTNCEKSTASSQQNCFSNDVSSRISKINCGCIPCDTPSIIIQGDQSNQISVPILANVIQNCVCTNKYEAAYPNYLVIETNLLKSPASGSTATIPYGNICITNISYSYSCIGVGPSLVAPYSTDTITGSIDGKQFILSPISLECSCGTPVTNLYTDFSGNVKTSSCCCNQASQPYAQNKIVERNISFYICNLSMNVSGTIGNQPFTGVIKGATTPELVANPPLAVTVFQNATPISNGLGFPSSFNFAEVMCLPTNTKLKLTENFDICFSIDCVKPMSSSYSVKDDPTTSPTSSIPDTSLYANFLASADLGLIINKTMYATIIEKLAVLTNQGSSVVCNNNDITPQCPSHSSCLNATPCPSPSIID